MPPTDGTVLFPSIREDNRLESFTIHTEMKSDSDKFHAYLRTLPDKNERQNDTNNKTEI